MKEKKKWKALGWMIVLPRLVMELLKRFFCLSNAINWLSQKPCAFLNINGYYDHLVKFYKIA